MALGLRYGRAMSEITREKLNQAAAIVAASEVDVWLTFVRETYGAEDPVVGFLVEGGLTWQSALLVSKTGRKLAVVGAYDADPLLESGDWDEVIGYHQSIRQPLLAALDALVPAEIARPALAVNFSESDDKADGLTLGMYQLLWSYLVGTRFAEGFVTAEPILRALRGRKTPTELARMGAAIVETDRLFWEIGEMARPGVSERAIYDQVHARMHDRKLGCAWDAAGDPIVNCGPNSPIGHTMASDQRVLGPGHLLHVDLGVTKDGYSSDLQRCWYLGPAVPEPLRRACDAVVGTIRAGFAALKPGVTGWEVDAAARAFLTSAGYPEYMHALGHQVGRMAHDGGGLLGPQWERYGQTPYFPVEAGQVYTLELGVAVDGYGHFDLEEMVMVTETGCRWLSTPQTEVWCVAV